MGRMVYEKNPNELNEHYLSPVSNGCRKATKDAGCQTSVLLDRALTQQRRRPVNRGCIATSALPRPYLFSPKKRPLNASFRANGGRCPLTCKQRPAPGYTKNGKRYKSVRDCNTSTKSLNRRLYFLLASNATADFSNGSTDSDAGDHSTSSENSSQTSENDPERNVTMVMDMGECEDRDSDLSDFLYSE